MKFLSTLAVILALALLSGACGGDSTSEADQALIDAMAAEFDSEPPPGDFDYDTKCMAEKIVGELGGADTVESKYGVTAAQIRSGTEIGDLNLDEATALSLTDKIWGCADFGELMMAGLAGEGMSDDDASCLLDIIGEEPIKQIFAAEFMGEAGAALEDAAGEQLFTVGLQAVGECGITP